jgi:hypothetical protein
MVGVGMENVYLVPYKSESWLTEACQDIRLAHRINLIHSVINHVFCMYLENVEQFLAKVILVIPISFTRPDNYINDCLLKLQ